MTQSPDTALAHKVLNATVVVAALGYLVDMFDLFLFNVTRVASLTDLGLSGPALSEAGFNIIIMQMAGILCGAYVWGVLGDRFGRKKCLLASIAIYSLGTLYCSQVSSVNEYAIARFVTGFGLAGEMGVGITLIVEKMTANRRGYGVMFFITLGYVGVILAAVAAHYLDWRDAYIIGGVAGLLLLLARALVFESAMFEQTRHDSVKRGGLRLILTRPDLRTRYLAILFMLATCTFIPQIMWTLSPEIGKAMGLDGDIKAVTVIGIGFFCGAISDLLAQYASERWKNRRMVALVFLGIGIASMVAYFTWPTTTLLEFYILNGLLGLAFGLWMMLVSVAAEQFGVNHRATATTTLPNFARGLAIPMVLMFGELKQVDAAFAAMVIGAFIFTLATISWFFIHETYGKDLKFHDQ